MSNEVSYRHYSGTAAENYERYFVPAIARPVATDLLRAAALKAGERVLDVACGTGVIARLAAERVGSTGTVVGVDVAPDMIEVARTTAATSGLAIEWRQGDAASLPLPDSSFDVVLSQMGLMLFADKPAALSEMRRVLVAGGRLALNTPGTIKRPMEILAEGAAATALSASNEASNKAAFSA
ncbi:MAG: class I SAM-dependent methyltransferase [Acidimicrobiales bacterium]